MTTSELLEKIIEELKKKLNKQDDFTDYEQVQDYAIKVADTISKAVVDRADSSWINQYGTLDYNLCNELITELLKQDYEYVKEACNVAQLALNEGSNIDLKAILPDDDDDRAHSIVWESANKSLAEFKRDFPVMTDNFSQSIVDDAVRKNADFQWKSGLEPKIVRMAEYKCCEWCSKLEGTYRYEDVKDTGNDVFRRHENCRCKVTYIPSKGNAKDVWSKRDISDGDLLKRIDYSERLFLDDIAINKSVGAKTLNYYVRDLTTGEDYQFVEGTKIQNIEVFAGKGTKTKYRLSYKLSSKYGGKPENWQHVKGTGYISTEDGNRKVEVHWSQHSGIGKFDFFIKKWLD